MFVVVALQKLPHVQCVVRPCNTEAYLCWRLCAEWRDGAGSRQVYKSGPTVMMAFYPHSVTAIIKMVDMQYAVWSITLWLSIICS